MPVPVIRSDLWWKSAVFYCLDVETYLDTTGNGHGDFHGLTQRLDHICDLGATCLWLMPFYPSPNRDDGYDIADYYGVDSRLGTLGDFVVMLREAHARGLKVITDLVVNHTSDAHPWFVEARSDPESPFRDFYVWRDVPPEDDEIETKFPQVEESVWSWDEQAGQYYLHHFFSHQPDLNIGNPEVWAEVERIAGFWLQLGVDGFRVDAVPSVLTTGGLAKEDLDLDPHSLLVDLRSFVQRRQGDALLLGEVDLPLAEAEEYFGDSDQLHMLFNFPLNQALFLALVRGDARPIREALAQWPQIPSDAQWATFVRNHDELNLGQLTEGERQEVFDAFAPDEDMRIFGRGIRRRLPSMLGGDLRRMQLAYSLLFTLPGSPVLFYGEEIGMGGNLDLPGRLSVRTPMQWTGEESAGFSKVSPGDLCRSLPEGRFGPGHINVESQDGDDDSLLEWMRRAIHVRKSIPEIGWGRPGLVKTSVDAVFAHRCDLENRSLVAVHNLSDRHHKVELGLEDRGELRAVFGSDETIALTGGGITVDLDANGYRWFLLDGEGGTAL